MHFTCIIIIYCNYRLTVTDHCFRMAVRSTATSPLLDPKLWSCTYRPTVNSHTLKDFLSDPLLQVLFLESLLQTHCYSCAITGCLSDPRLQPCYCRPTVTGPLLDPLLLTCCCRPTVTATVLQFHCYGLLFQSSRHLSSQMLVAITMWQPSVLINAVNLLTWTWVGREEEISGTLRIEKGM